MRVFVGLAVPDPTRARLAAFLDGLRPLAPLRWSDVLDLHVTTRFVGELTEADVAGLEAALAPLAARAPFDLAARGVGSFPGATGEAGGAAPRILWAGIDPSAPLAALAADTERVVVAAGVAPLERPYVPHITLARVPAAAPLDALREGIAASPSTDFGGFVVDAFVLYESRGGVAGNRYHPLATFPFRSE